MTPARAFEQIGGNEAIRGYRDFEEPLEVAARAILTGEALPDLDALDGLALRRLGYLTELVRGWRQARPVQVDAQAMAERAHDRLPALSREARPCFFHADPPSDGDDQLAVRWGLRRGVNVVRLRRRLGL